MTPDLYLNVDVNKCSHFCKPSSMVLRLPDDAAICGMEALFGFYDYCSPLVSMRPVASSASSMQRSGGTT